MAEGFNYAGQITGITVAGADRDRAGMSLRLRVKLELEAALETTAALRPEPPTPSQT